MKQAAITLLRRVAPALMFALCMALGGPIACVDFAIDDEQYICRAQEECGEGFACLRGPGCYCVCKALGQSAEPDCQDPNCLSVSTQ